MMGRKIRITEEQYKRLIEEGVAPKIEVNAQTTNPNGQKKTPQQAIEDTEKEIVNAGGDINKFKVKAATENPGIEMVSNNSNQTVSENKLITKKQLQESRLKVLKKNSQVYSVKDFINKFNK